MALVDASVRVEHFRKCQPQFAKLLNEASVPIRPFIPGELACGNLKNRADILRDLEDLPQAVAATREEALYLMSERKLLGARYRMDRCPCACFRAAIALPLVDIRRNA